MKITKIKTETYSLSGNSTWGKINLDIKDETVNVMITSDFGDYNYYWGSCGSNPKEFLASIDKQYTLKKLCQNSKENLFIPDYIQRKKQMKLDLINARKEYEINKNDAKEIWDNINFLPNYFHSEDEYIHELMNNNILDDFYEFYDEVPSDSKINPIVDQFWEKIWVPFTNELKNEMKIN